MQSHNDNQHVIEHKLFSAHSVLMELEQILNPAQSKNNRAGLDKTSNQLNELSQTYLSLQKILTSRHAYKITTP